MFGFKMSRSTQAFNRAILLTFGKLDQTDIEYIDGSEERLLAQLVRAYGWNVSEANSKVQQFRLVLASTTLRRGIETIHDGVAIEQQDLIKRSEFRYRQSVPK